MMACDRLMNRVPPNKGGTSIPCIRCRSGLLNYPKGCTVRARIEQHPHKQYPKVCTVRPRIKQQQDPPDDRWLSFGDIGKRAYFIVATYSPAHRISSINLPTCVICMSIFSFSH